MTGLHYVVANVAVSLIAVNLSASGHPLLFTLSLLSSLLNAYVLLGALLVESGHDE